MKIKYKSGYKYQLTEDYKTITTIIGYCCDTEYILLTNNGELFIHKGYAWDGPSGPTVDDKHNMRGSLEHDAKYQLMRLGLLPGKCKEIADIEFMNTCLTDGMSNIRAWYYYTALKYFGYKNAKYGSEQKIKEAP